MTESGPLWYEQADQLARYVTENQTTKGLMNDSGTSDAVSTVSIHIGGFIDCLKSVFLLPAVILPIQAWMSFWQGRPTAHTTGRAVRRTKMVSVIRLR